MRFEIICKYIGISLLFVSAFMFLSAAVSLSDDVHDDLIPLLYSGSVIGILGLFPQIFTTRSRRRLNIKEGYSIVVGSWVFCCLSGTIPFLMYGGEFSFTNALFESISGFTTTGATILNNIEALPQGLQFWRMSTAWIGGIGIVALFSIAIPSATGNDTFLTGVEISDIARDYSNLKATSFVHMMIGTYITLTFAAFFCLKIAGMRWFDAAAHAMSACSTCGFSTKNASIAAFDSPLIETILIVFMILASLRFGLLYAAFRGRKIKILFQSEISRTFLEMMLVFSVVITAGLFLEKSHDSFFQCFREATFQTASIITTTGFATVDTNVWPGFCALVIVTGSLVCGCSGSTSGGIKTDRLVLANKILRNKITGLQAPNSVSTVKIDGRTMDDSMCSEALVFIVCYILIVCLGAIGFSACGIGLRTACTASVACMGNVGPGMGAVGSMANYAGLPVAAKYIAMVLMLVGRLEIFPVLYILGIRKARD